MSVAAQQGWVCPACGAGCAPWLSQCLCVITGKSHSANKVLFACKCGRTDTHMTTPACVDYNVTVVPR